ncbi:hypothetical protein BC938DRAFT_471970 [Jimgerdemannia flammicorona]|uniref:Zinc finger PHD-type domain-containing protein n=1 Tax=Jimgerdemannia flammicorona TaxID=994334 RepID=A0A433Q6Z7_9FUNG|nr:hypothetical protein BC938DRAFT_471970 [Jimgerdemannia flammicorona]
MTSPRRSRVGNRGGRNPSSRRQTQTTQQQDLTSEEESSDAGSVTRCVCGQQHHVGMMVQCDKCEVWQHCDCVGLEKDDIPDQYYCELCKPENHTIVKGHGRDEPTYLNPLVDHTTFRNKRVYNPHGGKDVTNKTMNTKKRTTMNSRETSVPPSDIISPRSTTSKSHSQDDPSEYMTGRTSKRRRKVDDADHDHDAKPRRSTSPTSSRHPATGRRRETSKSTDDSTASNGATRAKRSHSASPPVASSVTVEEHSYESADEASSSGGGGSGSNAKGKKRRRTDKTASNRRGSTSANDVKVKPDLADERESLADALFVKEELSDVERPLGGDDDDDMNMDHVNKAVLASPEQRKELTPPTSVKANGGVLAPRSQPLRRTPSASRRNLMTNLAKSRENGLTALQDSSYQGSSSRQQSRATTPQPSDLASSSSTGGNDDRERSRCLSPPARVRYPSSRMSLDEMNKRAKQILEYISRMQVEIADDKKEQAKANEEGAMAKSSAGGADTEKEGLVMHVEALSLSEVEVSHDVAVAAAPNILITAATTASTIVNSQPESASSSNSPSPVDIASAIPAATATTTMTSDSHTIHPQPSLSSSSTTSTISSATTTMTSDADLAPGSLTLSASTTGNLTSLEMITRLARELINFQRRFGGHHHDNHAIKAPVSSSALVTTSTTTIAVAANAAAPSTSTLTPPPHHHNTRERGRSERERERSADRRDVVESLLLMSADLGAAFGSLRNAGTRHAEREGNAGTFVRRAEGSVRRTASVTVR